MMIITKALHRKQYWPEHFPGFQKKQAQGEETINTVVVGT